MQFITNGKRLEKLLVELADSSTDIYFAVAWARKGTDFQKALERNATKIRSGVIGLDFYQTSSTMFDVFANVPTVSFFAKKYALAGSTGIFHPKAYLFRKGNEAFHIVIGSANMTVHAFNHNYETALYMTAKAHDAMCRDIVDYIASFRGLGALTAQEFKASEHYAAYCEMEKRIPRVDCEKKEITAKKSNIENLIDWNWKEFFAEVNREHEHRGHENALFERIRLLDIAHEAFARNIPFGELPTLQRKAIGGVPLTKKSKENIDCGWFGSMKGAGVFSSYIVHPEEHLDEVAIIAKAIDCIPLQGGVSKKQYGEYATTLLQLFPDGKGFGVAILSRFLAMKRPDVFVCLNSKNKMRLEERFSYKSKETDPSAAKAETLIEEYWGLIERIHKTTWFNSLPPREENGDEYKVWQYRVAMLDAITYHFK